MSQYYIGIDIGTQSIRTALINEELEIVGVESIPNLLFPSSGNRMEQRPRVWWEGVQKGISSVLKNTGISPADIASIGVCAIMHCPVAISAEGELLEEQVQIYSDKRCSGIVERFENTDAAKELLQITANAPSTCWTAFKVLWQKEHRPDIYEKTSQFIPANAYIAYKLCGKLGTDLSEASGTFLMDAKARQWSPRAAELLGLSLEKWPPIYQVTDILGYVTEEAAKITGLAEGTPVIMGTSDMSAASFGSGLTLDPGKITVGGGTASGAEMYNEEPIYNSYVSNVIIGLGGWDSFGIQETTGGALRWFANTLFPMEKERLEKENKSIYGYIDELAADSKPGANGVLFLPLLLGERNHMGSPYAKGSFVGLSMEHTRGDMARAVLEGVAYAENRTVQVLVEHGGKPQETIRFEGGQASSKLWMQIRSDVFGHNIGIAEEIGDAGMIGMAIYAGLAVGSLKDYKERLRKKIAIKEIYTPNSKVQEVYRIAQKRYEAAHRVLSDFYQADRSYAEG